MSSKSWSTTTAIDNRLAVTDNAFGLSSSGSGNQVALAGPIINASAGSYGGAKSGAGNGGSVNVNVLDGGAIGESFNFARNALSDMLASVIDGQKQQQEAANYQADSIGKALEQSAATNAAAQAAATQQQAAQADKMREWLTSNGKILAGGAVVLLAGWWIWKGRKK